MGAELEQLGERIAEQAAHMDAAMHGLLTDVREFDRRGGWSTQGATSCAHWLSWRIGWTLGTARDRLRVAKRLGGLPRIDHALATGELSYSKVRALVRVGTPATEALLLTDALYSTAAQLDRICRAYAAVTRGSARPSAATDFEGRYVRRRYLDDGMVRIEAVLRPEEAEAVWSALDAMGKSLASGALAADVTVAAAAIATATDAHFDQVRAARAEQRREWKATHASGSAEAGPCEATHARVSRGTTALRGRDCVLDLRIRAERFRGTVPRGGGLQGQP